MTFQSPQYLEPKSPVGTVAELFAGVGGFRIGLAQSGWKTVFSNQWEPSTKLQHASDVYVARFGSDGHSNEDIATVDSLPTDVDLLVGGFPCQDYSVAKSLSSSIGLQGKKGVLWWEILRLVMQHKPKFLFLENVDRLLKSPSTQRGRDFAVMLSTLGNAGYEVEWRVVNAADYGFPQRRIRVFIIATLRERANGITSPEDVIFREGVLSRALPVRSDSSGIITFELDENPAQITEVFNQGGAKSPFNSGGYFAGGVVHTARVEADYFGPRHVLGDVLEPDDLVPESYWISPDQEQAWTFLKGAKSVERTHKASGFKYRYSEGKMTYPDALDKPSRTILTGEGGVTPSRFKHVIRTPDGLRRLLPVELERLSGFPDGWTKPDSLNYELTDARRAFFIGNALVVGLIEKVGSELARRQAGSLD